MKERLKMSSKNKALTIAVTTAALLVSSIGVSQASPQLSNGSMSVTAKSMDKAMDEPKLLVTVLAALVTKGTITQVQSDAITAALVAAKVAAKAAYEAEKVAREAAKAAEKAFNKAANALQNDGNHSAREALIALTIGMDVKVLHSRSKAGESLATIAGAKKDALIAALVLDQTKRIDAFVAAGKITVAQATILKAGLVANVTAEVNAAGDKNGGHHKGYRIGHMNNDND